ncbi:MULTISPECIES: hypothetical protein [Streptomycetaceae]|uniref:Uncharacterized protein n=1 Tax=Streptantibioticus cattleyicolor (strain ATCC 35852 / DSM 46488 / JCM 4925 / NBRC 14057 / NRRL 8057) TaxID=1003195 RepID=F8JS23_STREN|nr:MULTISPECIES: hypothetical protein [Streptomycetaceae]AEW92932.1 hypothetical protein SCATT_05610 [Streptantibioticus cattleyicolor NRRL 8057 = DSM 46488]MYS57680.1 hypothetical protein [Streptomyces sp. SID5468]CCB73292.1 protein of unknown function [Streptantibioticus cattleyicolor NRRL 8057 = DSM 46488]
MAERHTLPSGAWVELRDWRELRRGDKKRALSDVTDTTRPVAAGYELADALLTILITAWSYQLPLPSASPESLDLLPIEDDQPLMDLVLPAIQGLVPTSVDTEDADPASPSVPSAA